MMPRKGHWERLYNTKGERDVSWFEPLPSVSIQLLETAGLTAHT
jgi:hypothetical protein